MIIKLSEGFKAQPSDLPTKKKQSYPVNTPKMPSNRLNTRKTKAPDIKYWDSLRFKYHGNFTICIDNFIFRVLTNTSPYVSDS